MTKTNNSLTKYQVKELQADVASLKIDMRKIMENELRHLKEQINGLSTQVKEQVDGISGQVKLVGAINVLAILAVIALTQLIR